jgi:hypothetical protein
MSLSIYKPYGAPVTASFVMLETAQILTNRTEDAEVVVTFAQRRLAVSWPSSSRYTVQSPVLAVRSATRVGYANKLFFLTILLTWFML